MRSLTFGTAQSAHQIDDKHDKQNQAKSAATDHGTAEIKTAAAEQEEKKQDEEYWIHPSMVAVHCFRRNGAFTSDRHYLILIFDKSSTGSGHFIFS